MQHAPDVDPLVCCRGWPTAFRQEAKEKSKRKAEQVKKRKAEEAERLHPHQSAEVTEHIADIATQGGETCVLRP